MKYKKIPLENLGMAAYLLLQTTKGVFKWNGELFFCPFVTLENKKHPLRVSEWRKLGFKSGEYSLPFIDHDTLWLFADPVDPVTYTRTRHRVMDMSLGIDKDTTFLIKNRKILVKRKGRTDLLEFVKNISDKERVDIFNPKDSMESDLRASIWMASKVGNFSTYKGCHKDKWVEEYRMHRQNTPNVIEESNTSDFDELKMELQDIDNFFNPDRD